MMNTVNLFPIPVSTIELPPVGDNIISYVKDLEYEQWNPSLLLSKNHQILDEEICKPLKDNLLAAANEYWRTVICADPSVNLTIRHSWVTKHVPGQFNSLHTHTTCLFVSSLYLQAPENSGNLILKKDKNYLNLFPSMIDIDFHSSNLINSKDYSITPRNNLAVFFPSHLAHETEINNSEHDRYALNVDYWFEGTVRNNSRGFESKF